MARWYGAALTTGSTVEAVQSWPDRIRAVTADAVNAAAKAWLDKRRSVTGYLIKDVATRGQAIVIRRLRFLIAFAAVLIAAVVATQPAARDHDRARGLARRHRGLAGARAVAAAGGDEFRFRRRRRPRTRPTSRASATWSRRCSTRAPANSTPRRSSSGSRTTRSSCASRSTQDYFCGSIRLLKRAVRTQSFDLLRLALNQPRFDADAIGRVREQILAGLRRETTDPGSIANQHLVAHRLSRPSLRPPEQRHAEIDPDHHRRRSADLCDAGARARHAEGRRGRRHRRGDARPDARPRVRRAARDGTRAAVPDAPVQRRRPADRGAARRAAGGGAHGRRRHHAQGPGFHPGLSWSTTSSAAARSPRGSMTRCARSAASPTASIPIC